VAGGYGGIPRTRLSGRGRPPIDRARPADLMMLAMDRRSAVPQHVAALLMLDNRAELPPAALKGLIAERASAVSRLRQRLHHLPPGLGRPVWVDDPDFDASRHVRLVQCPPPGDEQALLQLTAAAVCQTLPAGRPLWAATVITGLTDQKTAILVVLHHLIADGRSALEILSHLIDGHTLPTRATDPSPAPTQWRLAADALRTRLRSLLAIPHTVRQLPASFGALGGVRRPPAAPCSLLRRTGPRRSLAVAQVDLASLHATVKQHHCTVNDAVLTAITGALASLLAQRGENIDTLSVTVPVAHPGRAAGSSAGNEVAPLVVRLPAAGDSMTRLGQVSAAVRANRRLAAAPSVAELAGPVFRLLAKLGAYRAYLQRQQRFHTLVSTVRGPEQQFTIGGARISSIIPLSVAETGNVVVNFVGLSYAGTLTITAVADPDQLPDLDELMIALRHELSSLSKERTFIPEIQP
jgi:diacylglycerol O-acyltransferase / wax synthase